MKTIMTDTGKKTHICRKEPFVMMKSLSCSIPLYKTLCGINAILSRVDEPNPTCKHCIKIRGNDDEEV